MVYSKSLERHLYTATGGDNDFTNVTSLRGVFMTSVLAEGMTVLIGWYRLAYNCLYIFIYIFLIPHLVKLAQFQKLPNQTAGGCFFFLLL